MNQKEPIILPEKYYLDYFNYLLDFVEKHYDHVLDKPEYEFYQLFRGLSEPAQCLYLRCSNRKGDYFRLSKLSYAEIPDITSAKEELFHQGFITVNESLDPIQFKLFTKSELLSLFEFIDSSQRKEELLLELQEQDVEAIHRIEEIIEVKKNQEVAFLKLLFFGNQYEQMTEFVIRDVGNIKLEKLDESKFKPWFRSREEALSVMHITQLRQMVRDLIRAELPLEDYLEEMPWDSWTSYPRAKSAADKLLLKLGAHFERMSQPELALNYYERTDRHPSRERQIRIHTKKGDPDRARTIAQLVVDQPANASELTFATDFLTKSGIRIDRSMTRRLKNAPSIEITRDFDKNVEQCVLEHLQEQGWNGVHTENYLWRGLFGLAFWDELFDEQHGSFHHPLQRQPSDLNDNRFYEARAKLLSEKLHAIKNKNQLKTLIRECHKSKEGIANRFVSWHESLLPTIQVAIQLLPLKGLKKVLLEMARNMKENSAGFPDLFIWKEEEYHFYEIKSPNDQLSAQQLFWLNFFAEVKIKSEVLKINYTN